MHISARLGHVGCGGPKHDGDYEVQLDRFRTRRLVVLDPLPQVPRLLFEQRAVHVVYLQAYQCLSQSALSSIHAGMHYQRLHVVASMSMSLRQSVPGNIPQLNAQLNWSP